jgi:hypothetical protein
MSYTSKSPIDVARVALRVAAEALPRYAHRFSPRKFTQPQLFACLALKTFFKTDSRGISILLDDLPDLVRLLGLKAAPPWTTLQKAAKRLLTLPAADRLLTATPRRLLGRKRVAGRAAFDSTGLACGRASSSYVRSPPRAGASRGPLGDPSGDRAAESQAAGGPLAPADEGASGQTLLPVRPARAGGDRVLDGQAPPGV